MFRKQKYINPFRIVEAAAVRQAYASGRNAGRLGGCTNPHPLESPQYTAWANGYLKGIGERRR